MSKELKPGGELWRHASLVLAPIVTLAALSAFAYEVNAEGLREARSLFVAVALLSVVASVAAQRVPDVRPIAVFLILLTFALTLYCVSALTGLASAVSLYDRPAGLIAFVSASWTLAALIHWPSAPATAETGDGKNAPGKTN